MIQKCKYYNNYQTACSLMIDDLVPAAVYPFKDNNVWAKYDWGYHMDKENSLYIYFQNNLLNRFPEIKGTFFMPLTSYKYIPENAGYKILRGSFNESFNDFLKRISTNFDFAFHGTSHGKFINPQNVEIINNWKQEFEYLTLQDIDILQEEISKLENKSGVIFTGGKYPGYIKNEHSEQILEKLGFKWWASSSEMINKKTPRNKHDYFGKQIRILNLPTNLSGDIFNNKLVLLNSSIKFKKMIKKILRYKEKVNPYNYIQYLYENQYPITIQEHFQNQRTDGIRQTPNIFDDISSLNHIYSILRGAEIWYVNCTKLSHYLESYDNTEIISNKNQIDIKYNGNWDKMFLSFASTHREIKNLESGNIEHGIYKNSIWIYNDLQEGKYQLI